MKNILAALLLLLAAQIQATTWYVATTGNDNNPGTLAQPFQTLPAAIEAANPGDEILLRGGNYTSQEIRINKSDLHLKSYPGEWAVITAVTDVEDVSACLWYNEPETTGGSLERLEIVGGYYYAIKFETNWDWDNSVPFSQRRGVRNVTVKDCNIHHSGRDAIKLTPACSGISIFQPRQVFSAPLQPTPRRRAWVFFSTPSAILPQDATGKVGFCGAVKSNRFA